MTSLDVLSVPLLYEDADEKEDLSEEEQDDGSGEASDAVFPLLTPDLRF